MRIVLFAALAALFLAGCAADPEPAAEPATPLALRVELAPGETERIQGGCDARYGTVNNVTIRDNAGVTVGAGSAEPGILQTDGSCFRRVIVPVTNESDFYEVTLGNRPAVTIPADRFGRVPVPLRIGY